MVGERAETPSVFCETLPEYIHRISFGGQLYVAEINDAAVAVATTMDDWPDRVPHFSSEVGKRLYTAGCTAPAAECFEISLRRQQEIRRQQPEADPYDHATRAYAQSYINAITAYLCSLHTLESPDLQLKSLRWFMGKLPTFREAEKLMEEYNEFLALKTVKDAYRAIAYLLLSDLA